MKSIQKELARRGLYTGDIDGICGAGTLSALYKVLDIENNDSESHFSDYEFRCKCNGLYCNGETAHATEQLEQKLEVIREHFGNKPVIIISGVRCKRWNEHVGGVANSYHLTGRAADIQIPGVKVDDIVDYAKSIGAHYSYNCGSAHVDF